MVVTCTYVFRCGRPDYSLGLTPMRVRPGSSAWLQIRIRIRIVRDQLTLNGIAWSRRLRRENRAETAAKSSRNDKSSPKTGHMPPDLVITKTSRRLHGQLFVITDARRRSPPRPSDIGESLIPPQHDAAQATLIMPVTCMCALRPGRRSEPFRSGPAHVRAGQKRPGQTISVQDQLKLSCIASRQVAHDVSAFHSLQYGVPFTDGSGQAKLRAHR